MSGAYTRYEVGSDGQPVLVTRNSSGRRICTIPVRYERPTSTYPQYRTSPTTYYYRPPSRHEDYSPVYPAHTRTVPPSAHSRVYPRGGATHHHAYGSRHHDHWTERNDYYERQRVQPPTVAVPPVDSAYPRRDPDIIDARPEGLYYNTENHHPRPRKASREPKVDRESGRKGKSKVKEKERYDGGSRKGKGKEGGKGREGKKESVRPKRREKYTPPRYSSECDSPPRRPDNLRDIRNSEKDAYAGVSDEALTPTEVKEVYTEQMQIAMQLAELYAWKSLPTWKSQHATLKASDPNSPSFISDTRTIRASFSKSFLDELYYQLRNMKKAEGGRDRAREDDLNTLSQCVIADLRKADDLSVDEFAKKFAKLDISRS